MRTLVAIALLATGCDSPSSLSGRLGSGPNLPPGLAPGSGTAPGDAPGIAKLLGLDAGEFETLDPPAPPGDLKADIDRFTTVEACTLERARLDPLLGDALEAIGYDTFLRDACRVIEAAKANDAKKCSAIDASSLEARCRATVAEVAGTPDTCPWETPSRPARGREPRCLAVASRDARLCAAVADPLDRATCEATLEPGDRSCAKLQGRAAQARCSRDADRWHGVLASDREEGKRSGADGRDPPHDALVVSGKLHVESASPSPGSLRDHPDPAAAIDVDLAPDLARGITLLQQRDGTRIVLGPLTEAGLDFIAPSPHVRASLALELFAVAGPRGAGPIVQIQRVELVVPGRPPLSTPGAQSTLTAKLDKLDVARASPVAVVVDGDISAAGSSWRVHAEIATFVRDVVRAADVYGSLAGSAALPRPSLDGGAR
ncbi:MAG TPA: hypothetical protein VK762_34785 [Polyangiaceae bacterium]|nr:hypothetical protein [Polyangiaceae bacterium]